jgi:radical SAM superfamily enzyme YgiQ (UPF0313 family)
LKYKISLVQINEQYGKNTILPLAIGMLWCYAIKHKEVQEKFILDQIVYIKEDLEKQAQLLSCSDVVVMSTYLWNYNYQTQLAQRIKKLNPNCYIVAGGPGVEASDFWIKNYNSVDLKLHGEGEESFLSLLLQFPNIDPASIPGAHTKTASNNLPDRIKNLDSSTSPYLTGFYDSLVDDIVANGNIIQAIIQTNRGCPYHCSFCESGDDYKNKIFELDFQRICDEFTWCAKNKVEYIMLADDNFGILPRDVELFKHVIDLKKTYGYPKILETYLAKNSHSRVLEIAELDTQHQTHLIKGITVALQSLNPPTLEAIKRYNVDENKAKNYVSRLNHIGKSTYSELIWPLPYETYDTFIAGINQLMELELDNWVGVYPLNIFGDQVGIYKEFIKDFQIFKNNPQGTSSSVEEISMVSATTWATEQEVISGHMFYFWTVVLIYFGFGRYAINQISKELNISKTQVIQDFITYIESDSKMVLYQWNKKMQNYTKNWLKGKHNQFDIFQNCDTSMWLLYTYLACWIYNNKSQFNQELAQFIKYKNLNEFESVMQINDAGVVAKDQKYPYTIKVKDRTLRIEKKHPDEILETDYDFCHFYYHQKRKNGWHRTQVVDVSTNMVLDTL